MPDFLTVAKVGDIPEGEGRTYPVNGKMIALFHSGGEYFAISDTCPHMGASLGTGYLEENSVYCPWHAWKFCIKNGTWLDNPSSKLNLDCYEVRIEGDDIQVEVPTPPETEPDSSG